MNIVLAPLIFGFHLSEVFILAQNRSSSLHSKSYLTNYNVHNPKLQHIYFYHGICLTLKILWGCNEIVAFHLKNLAYNQTNLLVYVKPAIANCHNTFNDVHSKYLISADSDGIFPDHVATINPMSEVVGRLQLSSHINYSIFLLLLFNVKLHSYVYIQRMVILTSSLENEQLNN